MGEVAEQVGQFVTAYSGDLRDESLDGQRIVVAGIVAGSRIVITKARATMAVVTLEDVQGPVEVIVFPRLYEQTAPTWTEGAILLVAGRVDHRGEEVSVLADLVVPWDEAVVRGPEAFARDVAAGERGAMRRRTPVNGNGSGDRGGDRGGYGGDGGGGARRAPVPVGPGVTSATPVAAGVATAPPVSIPTVSPLRTSAAPDGVAALPPIRPADPRPTYDEPPGLAAAHDDPTDEPALPDEARMRAVDAALAPTAPVDAAAGAVLHVRFSAAASERIVSAMEAFRQLLRDRPGSTRVVIHVPGPGGGEMELRRGIAYDPELQSEVRRRLGDGIAELHLS